MAEVLLFHHAQLVTPGVLALAGALRDAGPAVHAPDLYDGRAFPDLAAAIDHAQRELGFATILERGGEAAAALPEELVCAGLSLGALPVQMLEAEVDDASLTDHDPDAAQLVLERALGLLARSDA